MLLGEFPMCLCNKIQHQIRTGQFLDCDPRTCLTPHSPPGLEYHNPVQCLAPFCGKTFRLLQFTTKEHMHKKQKGPYLTLRWCELEKRKRHIHLTAPPWGVVMLWWAHPACCRYTTWKAWSSQEGQGTLEKSDGWRQGWWETDEKNQDYFSWRRGAEKETTAIVAGLGDLVSSLFAYLENEVDKLSST